MEEKLLESLGLTKGEVKVYLSLNKLGEATIGPIGSESQVSKSKIYDILDKLVQKGLVGYVIKNGTKYFITNDPHMILEYLSKKEGELEKTKSEVMKVLPQLISQRASKSEKRVAEVYDGFEGMKAIREELMMTFKAGDTFLVLGAPKIANDKWEGWLLDFHKRRLKRKVGMNIIYNSNARQEYGKVREKMKLTQVRYLPHTSPNWIDIFPEAIMLAVILETGPIAFVVRDKELAKSFKSYFELMWRLAKK